MAGGGAAEPLVAEEASAGCGGCFWHGASWNARVPADGLVLNRGFYGGGEGGGLEAPVRTNVCCPASSGSGSRRRRRSGRGGPESVPGLEGEQRKCRSISSNFYRRISPAGLGNRRRLVVQEHKRDFCGGGNGKLKL